MITASTRVGTMNEKEKTKKTTCVADDLLKLNRNK